MEEGVIRLKLITSSRRFKGFCGFGFSEDFAAHTPKECASEPSRAVCLVIGMDLLECCSICALLKKIKGSGGSYLFIYFYQTVV